MSFDQLRIFRDIASTGSISKAAEIHRVTPSAASQQLDALEKTLGSTLVDRSKRPLTLTTEGVLYNDLCRDVLRREEEFQSALRDLKSEIEGVVRVVAIYSIGISEMTELESEFGRRHPHVRLEVEYLRPEKIYEAVSSDRADLGLVSYPESTREIAAVPWRTEEMVLTGAPQHPLMTRKSIEPGDLEGVEFIRFDDDLPIAQHIGRYLKNSGVEMNSTLHFDNIQTIKEALLLGNAVSITPFRILRSELAAGRLAAVPLAPPGLQRPLGIIHRKKKRFSRAGSAFLELLREPNRASEPAIPAFAR